MNHAATISNYVTLFLHGSVCTVTCFLSFFQAQVPRPRPRDRGEGPEGAHRRPGQKEVPGSVGPDGGAVLLPDPEAHQPEARGRPLLLRQQRHPAHVRNDGRTLPGTYCKSAINKGYTGQCNLSIYCDLRRIQSVANRIRSMYLNNYNGYMSGIMYACRT